MFQAQALKTEIENIPHGQQRIAALHRAVAQADEAQAHDWRLDFRYSLEYEYIFHDDPAKGLPVCSEFVAIYDQHPELDVAPSSLLWLLKWAVCGLKGIYQIPLDQCERLLEELKQRCELYGYSLRSYHCEMCGFYRYVDIGRARRHYNLFLAAPRDNLSDCRACEQNDMVDFTLALGDYDRAKQLAEPIFTEKLICHNVPHGTYQSFLEYHLERGELDKAAPLAEALYPLALNNRNYLLEVSSALWFYALTDYEKAIRIYVRHLPWLYNRISPSERFYFYLAAWVLFARLDGLGKRRIKMVLDQRFSCFQKEGIYASAELAVYFRDQAKDLAARFDARNGTDYYNQKLNHAFPRA